MDEYESSQEKSEEMAKTKEQLEEEKRVALEQRIVPLDLSGLDNAALIAKAKELHDILYRLESEKYDLDDRFKRQQYDMMELAERARQMNKGGKTAAAGDGGFDRLAEKFPNVPPKVAVCSKYDRQTDKRGFAERASLFNIPSSAGNASKAKKSKEDEPAGDDAPAEEAAAEE